MSIFIPFKTCFLDFMFKSFASDVYCHVSRSNIHKDHFKNFQNCCMPLIHPSCLIGLYKVFPLFICPESRFSAPNWLTSHQWPSKLSFHDIHPFHIKI